MFASRDWRSLIRRLAGWPLLTALALTAFVLGCFGFGARLSDERSAVDLAYLSLQLFTVESGNSAGPSPPVTLEIARFLAPVTTAYALGRALVRVFRDEIEQLRLRRRHGHVVVVGLGWLGLALVERLVHQDRKVVAISVELDDEAIAAARRLRVPVIVGDARDPDVLREARADRADHVVILAGDDEINAEVALAMKDLAAEDDSGPLVCLAHIRDPQLCQMLRTEALADHRETGFRLEFFNVAEEAAAIMLEEHAGFLDELRPVRIGVVGGNDVAAAVVSEAARTRRLHNREPLDIVLAGSGGILPRLEARFPQLQSSANVEELPDSGFPPEESTVRRLSECEVVFVCLDQDTTAIAVTLKVADRLGRTPVVVALGQWAKISSMLTTDPGTGRMIHPFLVHDRLLDADLLLAGMGERLAREVHAAFLVERRAGEHDPDAPSMAEWKDLREEYRESSRAQAAHLGEKLQKIGCGLAPLAEWDEPTAVLTDDEIETLAVFEHERFVRERRDAGWDLGESDPDAKKSPYLIPWEELTEEIRDLDRAAARAVPALLARAGYRLVRGGELKDIRP